MYNERTICDKRCTCILKHSLILSFTPLQPAGVGPEGITVIASKNLVIVADEVDSRDDKIRSSLTIYQLDTHASTVPEYPTLMSGLRDGEDTYIPFSALSGLAAAAPYGRNATSRSMDMENILYTIEDSFYKKNRILTIDTSSYPAMITDEKRIVDATNVLMDCLTEFNSNAATTTTDDAAAVERQANINGVDITSVINDDKTVNIDPEGIATSNDGSDGFWIVSEGRGTIGDEDRPFETPNLLLKTNSQAEITECILLPQDDSSSWPDQLRFGFEGVATTEDNSHIVITVQRPWGDETNPRIAIYDTINSSWSYLFYPLDEVESQNGGWVGLSDIAPLGSDGNEFLILERDNQGGPDAAIKRIYKIDLGDYSYENGDIVGKTLFKDLIKEGDLTKMNGSIIEKVEGLAVTQSGKMWIATDNDGVDDSSGEQVLLNVGTYNDGGTGSGSGTDDVDDASSSSSSSSSGNAVSFEERTIVLIAIISSLSAIFAAFTDN